MKVLAARWFGVLEQMSQLGISPAAENGDLLDDGGNTGRAGDLERFDQIRRLVIPIALDAAPGQQAPNISTAARARRPWTRPARFIIRRCGLVQSASGSGAGCSPTPEQTAGGDFRAWHSRRRAIGQPEFGPALAGFFLLAGQPVAQGVDQVVVGQLVVAEG